MTQIKLARGVGYSFWALVGPGFMGIVRYWLLVLFLFSVRSLCSLGVVCSSTGFRRLDLVLFGFSLSARAAR